MVIPHCRRTPQFPRLQTHRSSRFAYLEYRYARAGIVPEALEDIVRYVTISPFSPRYLSSLIVHLIACGEKPCRIRYGCSQSIEGARWNLLIFPRFHGHRVKSPLPWLRTRRENESRGSNGGGFDCRIPRSIRKYPAWLPHGSASADDARAPFSPYGRSVPPRHCPSRSRADSCSPSGRARHAMRGRWSRPTETRGPYDAPRRAPVVGVPRPW